MGGEGVHSTDRVGRPELVLMNGCVMKLCSSEEMLFSGNGLIMIPSCGFMFRSGVNN